MFSKLPLPILASSLPLALVAGFIAFNPTNNTVANPEPSPAQVAATATPAGEPLPDGVSGRITYRTFDGQLVTVQVPERVEVAREPYVGGRADLTSADGEWRVHENCAGDSGACEIQMIGGDGNARTLDLGASLQWSRDLQWSPSGHTLAVRSPSEAISHQIAVIDDPASGQRRPITAEAGPFINAYAWAADGNIVASTTDVNGHHLVSIELSGEITEIEPLSEQVTYFYPSPYATQFAFTANDSDGWHLHLYDSSTRTLRDLGPMGAGGVVAGSPDVKTPMYVAWSPDGTRIAFGGGLEPPYSMTILDVATGATRGIDFAEGYPGEIKWTADSAQIAVSTYDPERTRHEVYVIDPATGVSRNIISGCIIVWSPDGRFIALHKEREHGIVVVDVRTLAETFLTRERADVVAWSQ